MIVSSYKFKSTPFSLTALLLSLVSLVSLRVPFCNCLVTTAATHSTAAVARSLVLSPPPPPLPPQVREINGWKIRPALREDGSADEAGRVLKRAFLEKCAPDYNENQERAETLRLAAALISKPQNALLDQQTRYVAEDPVSGKIVGCGGWRFKTVLPPTNGGIGIGGCGDTTTIVPVLQQFASHSGDTSTTTSTAKRRSGIGSALWYHTKQEIIRATAAAQAATASTSLFDNGVVAAAGADLNVVESSSSCSGSGSGEEPLLSSSQLASSMSSSFSVNVEVVSTLTAQPFYETLGFETIKYVDVPILLKKFPSVLMKTKIDVPTQE